MNRSIAHAVCGVALLVILVPGAFSANEPVEQQGTHNVIGLATKQLQSTGVEAVIPPPQPRVSALTVLVMTVLMAGAAGLGALPFFFIRSLSPALGALATATACGVMFAASFDLIHEGQPHGSLNTFVGVIAGALFIQWMEERLSDVKEIRFADLRGAPARRAAMMVGIMAAHALGEGCGVGVSFSGPRGWTSGLLTTLAIGVHNIPEGLATATVLAGQGLRPSAVLVWSIASCMPQPLVALPSYLFVNAFTPLLPFAMGFAAGCMIWMVIAELLPDALASGIPAASLARATTCAAAGLEGFRMLFEATWAVPTTVVANGDVSGAAGLLSGSSGLLSTTSTTATTTGSIITATSTISAELMLPALAVGCAAILAALCTASLVSLIKPPLPVALGLAGALLSGGALLQLLQQVMGFADMGHGTVPLLHTIAAAVVGACSAALLQHILLPSCLKVTARTKEHVDENESRSIGNDTLLEAGHSPPLLAPRSQSKSGRPPPYPVNNGSNGKKTSQSAQGPVLAAALVAVGAVAAGLIPSGWGWAAAIIIQRSSSFLLLPIALAIVIPGAAIGTTLTAALGSVRRGVPIAAGLVSAVAAACGVVAMAVTMRRYPADSEAAARAILALWRYPLGLTDTVAACTAGASFMAGIFLLGNGMLASSQRTRGGAVLGLLLLALVSGVQAVLCAATTYCLTLDSTSAS